MSPLAVDDAECPCCLVITMSGQRGVTSDLTVSAENALLIHHELTKRLKARGLLR